MTTTITDGVTSTQPLLVLTASHERAGGTIVHDVLDRPEDPDVTLRAPGTRQGTLELFYDDQADALAADALHAAAVVLALADTADPSKDMNYVVPRGATLGLRREIPHARWIVTVPYREVAP
jgi:hypothetical protein